MIKGEAKVLETDVVIFPMKFGQEKQEAVMAQETNAKLVENQPSRSDLQARFARLKKSLRKRSASIL